MRKYDFLVLGGGVAGLTYALEVAKFGSVCVLFKKDFEDSSTSKAQGGVAAVGAKDDDLELHIQDTLVAGAGLCKQDIVRVVVTEGPERIRELIALGASFDRDHTQEFHLHREGGHSRRRVFHSGDATGLEIQRALLDSVRQNPNIEMVPFASAVDLITTHRLGIDRSKTNRVLGCYVLLQGKIEAFLGRKTLMATGGAGKVYLYTSNPDVATGDGIAMCYRAGARVANMEFFQFHPTCLYHPQAKNFLITEAMRGEGAKLRRINGDAFMERYHSDAELAPRDVVARAIDQELKKHGEDYVLLDISHKEPAFVKEHFPTIYQRCLEYGYDISAGPIPVVPAAHYCCGGVMCNEWGETDLRDLYAIGECAHTGLHGANRLASNSLLEGLVFGARAARRAVETLGAPAKLDPIPPWNPGTAVDSDEQVVINQNWDEIRRFMWNYVGIVRSNKRLDRALNRSRLITEEIRDYYWNSRINPDLLELRNLSLVAQLVIRSAMARKESRGLHYNIDHPEPNQFLAFDTILKPF